MFWQALRVTGASYKRMDELEKWHHTISRSLCYVGQITKILEQHWKLLIIVIYKAYGAHRIKGLPPQCTGALQTFEVNPLFKIKLHYLFCKELNATEILSSYPEYRHTWNYYYSILSVKSDFTHLHRFTDIEYNFNKRYLFKLAQQRHENQNQKSRFRIKDYQPSFTLQQSCVWSNLITPHIPEDVIGKYIPTRCWLSEELTKWNKMLHEKRTNDKTG